MPTKALLYASEVLHLAGHSEPWGIRARDVGFDFGRVMARKDALIKEFADFRQQQLASGKFDFVRGFARFVDQHTVEVTPLENGPRTVPVRSTPKSARATATKLTARHFVIATGSVIAPSPLPQLDKLDCLDSDSALKLEQLPKSLIVLGGGAVAVEFTQFFSRFGVEVTLIQRSPHILHEFDPDAASVLEEVFRREGIRLYTGTKLLDARRVTTDEWRVARDDGKKERDMGRLMMNEPANAGMTPGRTGDSLSGKTKHQPSNIKNRTSNPEPQPLNVAPPAPSLDTRHSSPLKEIAFEHQGKVVTVQAEDIFFALGRIPNVYPLGLDKIGVHLEHHRIATNTHMQTSVPHIYAAGDCTGLYEIVHIAIQQGEVAAHNIAHPKAMKSMDYRLLTEVIFTEPQIATVGLTEERAHMANVPYIVASYPFNDHGKSLIMEAKDGFVKLLADPSSGEIIGGACVGPMGGELIHEIIAAIHKRMTVKELAAMPHYHPTLAEIWTYPAEELAEKVKSS
jgi:pyruvate/2-oxoglutarate dehydrogenase complex dihydrolipoamide dehydrogenase (E3) component